MAASKSVCLLYRVLIMAITQYVIYPYGVNDSYGVCIVCTVGLSLLLPACRWMWTNGSWLILLLRNPLRPGMVNANGISSTNDDTNDNAVCDKHYNDSWSNLPVIWMPLVVSEGNTIILFSSLLYPFCLFTLFCQCLKYNKNILL